MVFLRVFFGRFDDDDVAVIALERSMKEGLRPGDIPGMVMIGDKVFGFIAPVTILIHYLVHRVPAANNLGTKLVMLGIACIIVVVPFIRVNNMSFIHDEMKDIACSTVQRRARYFDPAEGHKEWMACAYPYASPLYKEACDAARFLGYEQFQQCVDTFHSFTGFKCDTQGYCRFF